MTNARAESVATKPATARRFKEPPLPHPGRRVLRVKKTTGKTKQPYHLGMTDGPPFAFAGLWEHWRRGENVIDSCTIITTEPNELAATYTTGCR